MKKFILPGMMALALIGSTADAQERWPKWYVGLHGSVSFLQDADLSGAGLNDMSFDNGYSFGGSLGYLPNFGNSTGDGLRFELEYSHYLNDIDSVSGGGISTNGGGDITVDAYMVNAFYDFVTVNSQWKPYVGAGIGWANVDLDVRSGVLTTNESDNVFAYQGMLGIAYVPTSIPLTEWSLGYRYLSMEDPEFSTPTGTVESEYDSHNIELGAKFRF